MKYFFLLSTLLLISSAAHAVSYSDQQETWRVMDRIERLERDLTLMQRQVYNQNTRQSPSIATETPPSSGNSLARIEARIAEIEEQMRDLMGKTEENQFAVSKLSEKFDKLAADNEYRFNALEKTTNISIPPTGDNTPLHNMDAPLTEQAAEENIITNEATPAEQYSQAFSFVRAAQYDEAELAFTTFITEHPEDPLAGSAYYWLGETYYVQAIYDKAAIQFLQSYKKFPKGKKAPESLLKLAMSLGQLQKRKDGCSALVKLEEEYPSSSRALKQRAKEEQTRLGCE